MADSLVQLGAFTLDHPIARGGMGEVWKAHHVSGTPVAVKVLTHEGLHRNSWLEGLHAEIRAVAGLDHPHIVWIHDAGEVSEETSDRSGGRLAQGAPWFAMELADQGTLKHRRIHTWDEARDLLTALLRALAHAHARGIVHRDIKPANVLFANDVPKLTDFGMVFSTDPTSEDRVVGGGTPAYMAPEQFEGERWDLGPWTDLYALGCLAYAVMVGRRPFPGNGWVRLFHAHCNSPIPALVPLYDVPVGAEDWLHTMMAKNRHHRYQRAADALHGLLALDEPTSASRRQRLDHAPTAYAGTTGSRRPIHPRPPLPHFRERRGEDRKNLPVGLGLYGLRTMPFVGRTQERGRLWEVLAAVIHGRRSRAIVLRGPAGVGKSQLARWLSERTHEVGAAAAFKATHAPLPVPSDGLAGLLARALRTWSTDEKRLSAAIRDELTPRGFSDAGAQTALASIIRPSAEAPELLGRRRHALVTRAITAFTNERPAVIWLDDVQWGPDAIDFADHLLTSDQAPPCLIVLTVRDDVLDDEPDATSALADLLEHGSAEELRLEPLEREASLELIQRGLGLEQSLAEQLHTRIRGNPMFAVELVGDWVERGLLLPSPEGFTLATANRMRTPANVGAVWHERIDQMFADDPSAQVPLALAAALGMEVDLTEWQEASAQARLAPPPDFWNRLEELRLVRREPGTQRFGFVHGLLREAILERARADGTLTGLHRAIAQTVGDDARKGTHLLAAGLQAEGTAVLLEAATRAATTDTRAALRLLLLRDNAIVAMDEHHPARVDGWLLASRVTRAAAKPKEALKWGERALELARRHGERKAIVGSLRCISSAARTMGQVEKSRSAIESALHLSDGLEPQVRAETLFECAAVLLDTGDVAAAERTVRRALQLEQDAPHRIRAVALLGYALAQQDQVEEARRTLEQHLELAQSTGHKPSLADLHVVLGEVERAAGREAEAERHYRRALEVLAGTGMVAPSCRANLALTLLNRGDVVEARTLLRRVQTEAHEIGARLLLLLAHAGLAACAADLRDWATMTTHLDALDADPGGLVAADLAHCLRYAGTNALAMGQPVVGRRALKLAAEWLEQLGRHEESRDLRDLLDGR